MLTDAQSQQFGSQIKAADGSGNRPIPRQAMASDLTNPGQPAYHYMVERSTYYTYYYLPAYYNYTPAVYSEYNYVPPYYKFDTSYDYSYYTNAYYVTWGTSYMWRYRGIYGGYTYNGRSYQGDRLWWVAWGSWNGMTIQELYKSGDDDIPENKNSAEASHYALWNYDTYTSSSYYRRYAELFSYIFVYKESNKVLMWYFLTTIYQTDYYAGAYTSYRVYLGYNQNFQYEYWTGSNTSKTYATVYNLFGYAYDYQLYNSEIYEYYSYQSIPPYYNYIPAIETNPIHYIYTEV